MGPGLSTAARWRAIVGAITLYALLLQGFLAAATPVLALDGQGILCLDHTARQPGGSGAPSRHDGHCCTLAQPVAHAPPPDSFARLAWPVPAATPVVWRPEADAPRTGPPERAHNPRGPPLA